MIRQIECRARQNQVRLPLQDLQLQRGIIVEFDGDVLATRLCFGVQCMHAVGTRRTPSLNKARQHVRRHAGAIAGGGKLAVCLCDPEAGDRHCADVMARVDQLRIGETGGVGGEIWIRGVKQEKYLLAAAHVAIHGKRVGAAEIETLAIQNQRHPRIIQVIGRQILVHCRKDGAGLGMEKIEDETDARRIGAYMKR